MMTSRKNQLAMDRATVVASAGQSCGATWSGFALTKGFALALGLWGSCLGPGQLVRAQAIKVVLPVLESAAAEAVSAIAPPLPVAAKADVQTLAASQAGYDFLEKGWVNDAIEAFQKALQQDPESLDAKLGLAIAYQRAGQDEQAWQTYNAVLERDGKNEIALRAVGTMASYRAAWQAQGIEALNQLLTLYPDAVEQRAQRAMLLGYQQRFGEAIADYEQLFARDEQGTAAMAVLPGDLQQELRVNAAQIYTYNQQSDLALPLFDRYLRQGGKLSRPATLAYTTVLGTQGRASQAIELLESLPSAEGAEAFEQRLALALAYQANADLVASLAVLQPLLEPLPQDWVQRRAIANALVPLDPPPVTLLEPLQALLQDPEPVNFLQFRLAQIQLTLGDFDGAQENLLAYQAATEEVDLGAEFLLADIEQRNGNLEASAQRYSNLMMLTEGDPRWDALSGLAAIRFERQRLAEAEGLYQQLLEQRPNDYRFRRTFAELMLAQDKPKSAIAQFDQAQRLLPPEPSLTELPPVERQRAVRRSFLRRRGFQPRWERY